MVEKKQLQRNVLFTPGPATTTDSVKYAQVVPDISPREKEFGESVQWICRELTEIIAESKDYSSVLLGGSGTAAVESMLSSTIDSQDRLLIIKNGAYGHRMCEIAETYGISYQAFEASPITGIDFGELEQCLLGNDFSHLAVIHHETTTGILNDIEKIGALCSKQNILFLVDAISSFAAVPINMQKMNISFLVSSANKNLQGLPGVSFVIGNNDALHNLKNIKKRCFYLNLYDQFIFF